MTTYIIALRLSWATIFSLLVFFSGCTTFPVVVGGNEPRKAHGKPESIGPSMDIFPYSREQNYSNNELDTALTRLTLPGTAADVRCHFSGERKDCSASAQALNREMAKLCLPDQNDIKLAAATAGVFIGAAANLLIDVAMGAVREGIKTNLEAHMASYGASISFPYYKGFELINQSPVPVLHHSCFHFQRKVRVGADDVLASDVVVEQRRTMAGDALQYRILRVIVDPARLKSEKGKEVSISATIRVDGASNGFDTTRAEKYSERSLFSIDIERNDRGPIVFFFPECEIRTGLDKGTNCTFESRQSNVSGSTRYAWGGFPMDRLPAYNYGSKVPGGNQSNVFGAATVSIQIAEVGVPSSGLLWLQKALGEKNDTVPQALKDAVKARLDRPKE